MPNLGHLEDKIRRSSSFRSMPNLYQYLEYASHCRDELQVYFYMQQNNICTDHPQFWLAMFNTLKLRCQFKLIIKKLIEIKKKIHLREYFPSNFRHHHYHKILEFQDKLTRQLEQDIRKRKGKKRRSLQEFELFSISKIQKKKRKVGGLQIYVDQDCRQNYKLEDFSEFFISHMQDEIDMRRFEYDRKQANKPLSFLGLHESNIQKWSFQLIDKNKRNSFIQQNNNIRESTALRIGNNDNNVSKRFSVSRKSNMNLLLPQNNPQSAYKTPKQTILNQTPTKSIHNQRSSKQFQVSTPVLKSKKLINDQSLIKACKKSEKYDKRVQYFSSSQSGQQEDISKKLNEQILSMKDYIDLIEDNSLNYPPHRQVIRANNQTYSIDDNHIINPFDHHTHYQYKQKNPIMNNFNNFNKKEEDTLNLGCVEWSMLQSDKRMVAQNEIDRQLKETILQTQMENVQELVAVALVDDNQYKDMLFNLESTQSIYEDYLHFQQQTQSQIEQSLNGFVMCMKSTQTLQSIDSNQQNLFSTKKQRLSSSNNHHTLQAFKKQRKLFQVISIQDNKFLINNSTQSAADYSIPRQNDIEMMSIQGNEQIQEMIDEMDNNIHEDNHNRNLVLQTLRKKKLSEILMRQDERQHNNFGTHSQKKNMLFNNNGLRNISQEKSYNSQRRYNSRERYSSEYFD